MILRVLSLIFLLYIIVLPAYAETIILDIQQSISAQSGETIKLPFSNTGDKGSYQIYTENRPSWVRIYNDNNQYRSGYLRLNPQSRDIGNHSMSIWSCRKSSTSICSDKKIISIQVTTDVQPLQVSVGNFSWLENARSTQIFNISGGLPPYTAQLTGSFNSANKPFVLIDNQKITCDNASTCLPPMVTKDSTFNFSLKVTDQLGNTAIDSFVITVTDEPKNDAPSPPILSNPQINQATGVIDLNWSSSTNSPNWYEITLTGNGQTQTKRPSPQTNLNISLSEISDSLQRGVEYSVYVQAHNTKGYSAKSNRIKFKLEQQITQQKPIIECVSCSQTGKINKDINFEFKAIGGNNEKLISHIEWGDGKSDNTGSINQGQFNVKHRYAVEGSYTIKAITKNNQGEQSDTLSYQIIISEQEIALPALPDVFKTSFLLGNPNNHTPANSSTGFGVNAVTGNFYYLDHDVSMPAKDLDFSFNRSYNSLVTNKDSFGNTLNAPLGQGWTHSYNIQLRVENNNAEIIWGDGSRDGFIWSNSRWLAITPNNRYQLQRQANSWIITSYKQTKYYFDNNKRLKKIQTRHDNIMQFDYSDNHLISIIDTAGRTISLNYKEDKLTQINLPLNRSIYYNYTNDGLLKAVTDMRGNIWRYVYQDKRLRVIHRANVSENNAGNDSQLLLKIKYDAQGRVEQQDTGHTATNGSTGTYSFIWGKNQMNYNAASGLKVLYKWDNSFRLTEVLPSNVAKNAQANKHSYTKNDIYSFLPDYLQDNNGNKTTLKFNQFDLTELTHANNTKSTLSYNAISHDLENIKAVNGLHTKINWSNLSPQSIDFSGKGFDKTIQTKLNYSEGLLDSLERGNQKVLVKSHHSDGQAKITVIQNLKGKDLHTKTNDYDDAGRLISSHDSLNNVLNCLAYDRNDNLIHQVSGVISCDNFTTVSASASVEHVYFEYTDNNQLAKKVLAYGSSEAISSTYTYNNNTGKISRSCLLAGGESRCENYRYDNDLSLYEITKENIGRKDRIHTLSSGFLRTVVKNAEGSKRRIERRLFDPNGNLISISSCQNIEAANKNKSQADCEAYQKRITIEYDSLDRPVTIYTYLDKTGKKRKVKISYSADGRIVTITQAEGNKIIRESDSLGRLIRISTSLNSESSNTYYSYDDNNNLIEIKDASNHITSFSYDSLGRRLSRSDLSGKQSWSYPDGLNVIHTQADGSKINYQYDTGGNLIKLNSSDGFNVEYSYNALGQKLTAKWSGYGKKGQRNYVYTPWGELDYIMSPTGKKIDYHYDKAGRMIGKNYAGLNLQYSYNKLNQLETLKGDAGNFTFYHNEFTGALQKQVFPNGVETTYQYNLAGELLELNTAKDNTKILNYVLGLDNNGRRNNIKAEQPQAPQISAESLNFSLTETGLINQLNNQKVSYDQRGNITTISTPFNDSYQYDVLNRVQKTNTTQHEYDDSRRRIAKNKQGKIHNYLWDISTPFDDIVAEYEGDILKRQYIYAAGGLLAQIDADGKKHYIHQDFNHNIVALTDNSANVSDSFAWYPYGRSAGRSGNTEIPFGFAGGVGVMYDSDHSIYMRARHYHTGLRQFTSPDLIEGNLLRPQSLNRYAYIEGMTFSKVDSSGLSPDADDKGIMGDIKNILDVGKQAFSQLAINNLRKKRSVSEKLFGSAKIIEEVVSKPSLRGMLKKGTNQKTTKNLAKMARFSGVSSVGIGAYFESDISSEMFKEDYEQIESEGWLTLAGVSIASGMDAISYGTVRSILKAPTIVDDFIGWDSSNYINNINHYVNSDYVYEFIMK